MCRGVHEGCGCGASSNALTADDSQHFRSRFPLRNAPHIFAVANPELRKRLYGCLAVVGGAAALPGLPEAIAHLIRGLRPPGDDADPAAVRCARGRRGGGGLSSCLPRPLIAGMHFLSNLSSEVTPELNVRINLVRTLFVSAVS